MNKQELLRQLAAALAAAGLLGAPLGAVAQEGRGTNGPAVSRRPAAGALYGITLGTEWGSGNYKKVEELEKVANTLLAYAATPEGKADMESDAAFKKLVEEVRTVMARIQRERAQQAPTTQPASQPR